MKWAYIENNFINVDKILRIKQVSSNRFTLHIEGGAQLDCSGTRETVESFINSITSNSIARWKND